MNKANLTRLGPQQIDYEPASKARFSGSFNAVEGEAELRLENSGSGEPWVKLNGEALEGSLLSSANADANDMLKIPLRLQKSNSIELGVNGDGSGVLRFRVTQVTQADLGLIRQGYFGLNTSDIEVQRKLYETLGFIGEIYPAGPETSTTFAQSLGFEDNYLIHVSLHSLEDPPTPPFVDTVQFREEFHRSEPPYAELNHIGMAYATYSTTDLDGDYAFLQSKGVQFLSAPATAPNGERFVYFKDQDGAFLKLIQTADGPEPSPGMNLVRLENTNMNVTDMERSREFYRLLGFAESSSTSQKGGGEFAAAHGFSNAIEFEGEDISFERDGEKATLQLRKWVSPFDDAPPYSPPVNHLGIDRINFYVDDVTAVVKTMNDLGFEQLGPIGGSKEIGIVFFFDPDGIKVQFAGPQTD